MTATNPTPPRTDPQLDKLATLHRMSRTAGAGTSEYAAVNPASVVAVILGIAGLLVLFNWTFIIIPVGAIAAAVIAIVQIRGSNATQTGLVLAIVGLLLAIGCVGFKSLDEVRQRQREKADEAEIEALVAQMNQKVLAGEYQSVIDDLFDPRLKERIQLKDLKDPMEALKSSPQTGGIKGMRTNGLYRHFNGEEDKSGAQTQLLVDFKVWPNPGRYDLFVQGTPGHWKVVNIPDWFPAKKPQDEGAPAQPAEGTVGPPMPRMGPIQPAPAKP